MALPPDSRKREREVLAEAPFGAANCIAKPESPAHSSVFRDAKRKLCELRPTAQPLGRSSSMPSTLDMCSV